MPPSGFPLSYNHFKITFQEGPWQEVHLWLDNKEIDVAFCSYSKNSFHDFIPLAKDKLVAMLPKNHPMAKRKNFPIDKLSGEKLILPQEGKYCNAVLMLKEKNIPFNIYLTTKEVYASMGMVSQGLGITVLNELITQGWHNRTVIIPIEPVYTITLGIELPSISKASPAAKVFVKHAVKMLKKI